MTVCQSGFTLIELVLTIALLGIVTITAIPKVNTAEQALSLDGAARSMESDLKYAQNLASVTGQTHGLQINPDNESYTVYSKDDNGVETPVLSPHDHNPMQIAITDNYQGVSVVPQAQPIDIEFGPNGLPIQGQSSQFDLVNLKSDTKSITISGTTGRIDVINPAP